MSTKKFRLPRRVVQILTTLLIALIPTFGIFQIDLASASFHVLSREIWWSNFAFIIGLAIVLATAPVITYMTIGAVWCGWACPQNLISEWANNLTYRFLGKRADVRVDGKGVVIAASKNKAINWIALGTIFLGASLILAFIPIFLFYPVSDVWDFINVTSGQKIAPHLEYPYVFTVILIFIDIAFLRYFFCDYGCFYRMGQRMLNTRDALHVTYDASRSSDCTKCNYCATSCITAIQPTAIKIHDPCIGCGECIDACDALHDKSGTPGLLRFKIGTNVQTTTWLQKFRELSSRFNWLVGAVFLLGIAMMAWGVVMQEPVRPKLSWEAQQKIQLRERFCNKQCAQLQSTCRGDHMEGCYRAAACKCECSLHEDPDNAASDEWRQCVQKNTQRANKLDFNKSGQDIPLRQPGP